MSEQTETALPGLRYRPGAETRRPKVWTPELLTKVEWRREAAAEPFRGVSTGDGLRSGLFPLRETGIDTSAVRSAAEDYLSSLTPAEEMEGIFTIDHESWRHWSNGARYFLRHGLCMEDLSDEKRRLALAIVSHSLSGYGYQQVLDLMHLNRTIGEIRGEVDLLNEWLYWFSIYGRPEEGGPWGWQLDGHHVNVNCMFVGDQMVLTPTFLGAEPTEALSGRYAGTTAFRREEAMGRELLLSLDSAQRKTAVIADELPDELFVGAFRDNFELNVTGLSLGALTPDQEQIAADLIDLYVGRAEARQARIRAEEVFAHRDETFFSWIGDPDGVFYYRIHSPVILIEFEHQAGVLFDNDEPSCRHIHTVVRTPNGNDYGFDLLRQHHEHFHHDASGHHHHASVKEHESATVLPHPNRPAKEF